MSKRFGFIREKLEIKVLILFILRLLQKPVPIEDLVAFTILDEGISYFDFMECVSDLVRTEHILLKDKLYSITDKGIRNGEITAESLPYSVRMHTEDAVFTYRIRQQRIAMINTKHVTKKDGGCTVSMSLSDGVSEIVSIDVQVLSERQALAFEEGFQKNAEKVYNALIKTALE